MVVGLILGSSQLILLPPAAYENDSRFKSGQNKLENNHLINLN